VGAALPFRIRKALVALRSARRRIVEDGQWVYLYRAVDKAGQTVDFFRNRDVNAAKSFLRSCRPQKEKLSLSCLLHQAILMVQAAKH
jgi:hypothetical protein